MKLWVLLVAAFALANVDAGPAPQNAKPGSGTLIITPIQDSNGGLTISSSGPITTQGKRTNPVAKVKSSHSHHVKRPKPIDTTGVQSLLDNIIKAILAFFEPIITLIRNFFSTGLTQIVNNFLSILETDLNTLVALVRSRLNELVKLLGGIFQPIVTSLTNFLTNPLGIITGLLSSVLVLVSNSLASFLKYIEGLLGPAIGDIVKNIGAVLSTVLEGFLGLWTNLVKTLSGLLQNPINSLGTLFKPLVELIEKLISGKLSLSEVLESILLAISRLLSAPAEFIKPLIKKIESLTGSPLPTVLILLISVFAFFPLGLTIFVTLAGGLFSLVGSLLVNVLGLPVKLLTGVFSSSILTLPFNIIGWIFSVLSSIITGILNLVVSIFSAPLSGITSLLGSIASLPSIILKLLQSILSIPGSIISVLLSAISSILNSLTFGISGVSKLFTGLSSGLVMVLKSVLFPVTALFSGLRGIVTIIWNILKFVVTSPVNLALGRENFFKGVNNFVTNTANVTIDFVKTLFSPIYFLIESIFPSSLVTSVINGISTVLSYVLDAIVVLLENLGGAVFSTLAKSIKRLTEAISGFFGEIGQLSISSTSLQEFFDKLPLVVLKHKGNISTILSNLVAVILTFLQGGLSKIQTAVTAGLWPLIENLFNVIQSSVKGVISSILTLLSGISIDELFSPLAKPFQLFLSGITSAFDEIVQIVSKAFHVNVIAKLQEIWQSESEVLSKTFATLLIELKKAASGQENNLAGVLNVLYKSVAKFVELLLAVFTGSLSPIVAPINKLTSTVSEFLSVVLKFVLSKITVLGEVSP